MDKLCIFFVYGMSGGTATLSYRIGQEYRKKGFHCIYVCEEINDSDNYNMFKEQGTEIIISKASKWLRDIKDKVLNAGEAIVWVYSYEIYAVAEKVRHLRKNLKTNIFLYVVHERCLIRGNGTKKGLYEGICSWVNSLNALYVRTIDLNNELLFMERRIIDLTEKYLNIQFPNAGSKVLPLPYPFRDTPIDVTKRKKAVSTMARIDFPFKGYILGLIDIFSKYYKDYGLELWIIGTGECEDELKNKILQLDSDARAKIKLFGSIEYTRVKDILKDSYVFVGMGTGLLDAASVMLPSIGVQAYRYECLGNGFLNENPHVLGYLSEQDNLHDITKELLEVLDLTPESYTQLCCKEYAVAKNYYGIDNFLHKLDCLHQGDTKHSLREKIGYKINYLLGKINLRLRQH